MDLPNQPFAVWISQARSGHLDALERLCNELMPPLRVLSQKLVRCPDSAEDLAQEVLVRFLIHLPDLRDTDRLAPWLSQCARNLACDWHRRHNTFSRFLATAGPGSVSVPAAHRVLPGEPIAVREDAQRLDTILSELTVEDRQLIQLHYGDGWSHRQIARHMGCHHSSVQGRLRTIEGRLRSRWFVPQPSTAEPNRTPSPRPFSTILSWAMVLGALSSSSRQLLAASAPVSRTYSRLACLGLSPSLVGQILAMKIIPVVAGLTGCLILGWGTWACLQPSAPALPAMPPSSGSYQPGQVLRTRVPLGQTVRYTLPSGPSGVQDVLLRATSDGRLEFQLIRDNKTITKQIVDTEAHAPSSGRSGPALPSGIWVNWRRVSGDRAVLEALKVEPGSEELSVTFEVQISPGSVARNSDLLPSDGELRARVQPLAEAAGAYRRAAP